MPNEPETAPDEQQSGEDTPVENTAPAFQSVQLAVKYYINDTLVSYQPLHCDFAGTPEAPLNHILPLMYQWQNGEAINNNLKVTLQATGGDASIARGDVISYIISQYGVEPVKNIVYIEVVSTPRKDEYYQGERLDFTGLIVHAIYDDGTEADITDKCLYVPHHGDVARITINSNESQNDVNDEDEGGSEELGSIITVDVAYRQEDSTFTTSFLLELYPAISVVGIYVKSMPNKSEYEVGEATNYTGLVVHAIMSDGSEEDITTACYFDPAEGTTV